jgi:hypothetical protein
MKLHLIGSGFTDVADVDDATSRTNPRLYISRRFNGSFCPRACHPLLWSPRREMPKLRLNGQRRIRASALQQGQNGNQELMV